MWGGGCDSNSWLAAVESGVTGQLVSLGVRDNSAQTSNTIGHIELLTHS